MIKLEHAILGTFIPLLIITHYSNKIIEELYIEINRLNNSQDVCECYQEHKYNVTMTMYNPVEGQTDSTPNELADGTIIDISKASEYKYVALSRNLLSRWGGPFNYDDYIMIKGTNKYDGIYKVKDTMSPKFINRVDLLRSIDSEQFIYEDITIYKYEKNNR